MSDTPPVSQLDQLAYELEQAKKAEMEAKLHRVNLEEQLCASTGVKVEGYLFLLRLLQGQQDRLSAKL